MLAGMSKEEKQILDLSAASDYVYLNQVGFYWEIQTKFSIEIPLAWWNYLLW
jgi:hypothetical protein